jgi:LacI family transcriptional regulator
MPVTIKDIARVAGVSHTTVSRALLGNPAISARAPRSTTQRLVNLAAEMGYVPSAVTQGLRSRTTRPIGMVLGSIADPFIGKVLDGIERFACSKNYSVFISTSHNKMEREMAAIETLYRRRVDAIIIASLWLDSIRRAELDRIKIPIVFLNNQIEGYDTYSACVESPGVALNHM